MTVLCERHLPEAGEFYNWANWICVREDSLTEFALYLPAASSDGCSPPLSYADQRFQHHTPKNSPPLLRGKSLQTHPQQMSRWGWTQPEMIFSTAGRFGFPCGCILLPQLYLLLLGPEVIGQYLYLISSSYIKKHIQGGGRWLQWSQKSSSFFCSFLEWQSPSVILRMFEPSTISVSHTPEREVKRYGVKQVPLMHINTSDGK